MNQDFWKSKRVLITGHTGFKGSWLSLWLQHLGADVYGYSLSPVTDPNLYGIAEVSKNMESTYGDILDYHRLQSFIGRIQPEVIFHLAAQPLVRESYLDPIATFSVNVMGTVHLLEVARNTESVQVVINVTTDKCYENNNNSLRGFVEHDPMGGSDPYSASKGCSELVTSAYERSFYSTSGKLLSSARAGNVIGGGDWAVDRIIPDVIRSIINNKPLNIRYPQAIRPWQHVLDCLNGYLLLAQRMWESGEEYAGAWNFGPGESSNISVAQLIDECNKHLGGQLNVEYETNTQPYEASCLVLNSDKATEMLKWGIQLPVSQSIEWTMEWYSNYMSNRVGDVTLKQISQYESIKASRIFTH